MQGGHNYPDISKDVVLAIYYWWTREHRLHGIRDGLLSVRYARDSWHASQLLKPLEQ